MERHLGWYTWMYCNLFEQSRLLCIYWQTTSTSFREAHFLGSSGPTFDLSFVLLSLLSSFCFTIMVYANTRTYLSWTRSTLPKKASTTNNYCSALLRFFRNSSSSEHSAFFNTCSYRSYNFVSASSNKVLSSFASSNHCSTLAHLFFLTCLSESSSVAF